MYSKHARMKVIFDYELPKEQLVEIAKQHTKRDQLDNPAWRVDYYWLPLIGLAVVVDGKGSSQLKGYKCGVQDWRWDKLQDNLVYSILYTNLTST